MGVLLEFLVEAGEMFLGVMALFMVVVVVGALLWAVGRLAILGWMVPYTIFVGDGHDFKPERMLLVLGVLVGLFFVHWYYPLIFLGLVLAGVVVYSVGAEVIVRCGPSPETIARRNQAARLERRRAKAALRNNAN